MRASKVTSNGRVGNYYKWQQHPPILKKGFNLNTSQFSREALIQFTQ